MQIKISRQHLAKITLCYLVVLFFCSGLYTFYQSKQGVYDVWKVDSEGIVEKKFIYDSKPYLQINNQPVYVSKETYDKHKEGQKASLGHTDTTLSNLRCIHVVLSILAVGLFSIFILACWLDWIFNHSDSKTFMKYLKG